MYQPHFQLSFLYCYLCYFFRRTDNDKFGMLPSNPRAGRSRSVARQPTMSQRSASRPRERSSEVAHEDRGARGRGGYDGGNAREVRSQRSVANVRPSRYKEPALPPPPPPTYPKDNIPSRSMKSAPSTYSRPPPSRDSDSSSSSTSSSGSSFLDRMRHRGAPSSSSQSSFELDLDASKETGGSNDTRKPAGLIHHDGEPLLVILLALLLIDCSLTFACSTLPVYCPDNRPDNCRERPCFLRIFDLESRC